MLDKLDSIRTPIPINDNDPSDPDTDEISRKHAYNNLERDRHRAEEEYKDSRQNREQRKEYAGKIFWLVVGWLSGVGIILLLSGWKHGGMFPHCRPFNLSDGVLMTLIGGTSASVIGLMVIVANYLFPKNGHQKQ